MNVVVGSGVAGLEENAFEYCSSLSGIYFQGDAPTDGGNIFLNDSQATVYYVAETAGWGATYGDRPTARWNPFTYTINAGKITITGYIGAGGPLSIPAVIAGMPVSSIGNAAFQFDVNLTGVTIPNSVTIIDYYAFFACTNLTSANIGSSVATLGDGAFSGCSALTAVTLPNSVVSIGSFAFTGCRSLSSLATSNNVTSIGDLAFWGCSHLTLVTLGSGVASIGPRAFLDCTSLTGIAVDTHNLHYNSYYGSASGVLFNKSGTELLVFPEGYLGAYSIPAGVATIGDYAFEKCSKVTSITIPTSVTRIGAEAFYNCTGLTTLTLPNSVTNIGAGAFSSCGRLSSVILPGGITSLGTNVFAYCDSLTSITIPASVTSIAYQAFFNCTNLTAVYFRGNTPSLDSAVFEGDNKATVYYTYGTTVWSSTFGGRPAVLWNPMAQTGGSSFGVRTNQFGFNITTGSLGLVVVVEACTDLSHPVWQPLRTNTLTTGTTYFSDPQWMNYPIRFYRLRSP